MGDESSSKEIPVTPNKPERKNTASLSLIDDFDGVINREIWDLKRIRTNRWALTEMAGEKAVRITLEKGDKQEISPNGVPTERSEFSERKGILIPIDTQAWYGFSFYLPPDFVIAENRLVFAQWKQVTGRKEGPFLSFRYIGGDLIFQVAHDEQRVKFKKGGIDLRGQWHDVLVNYRLDKGDTGFSRAWVDSSLLAEYEGKLGYEISRDLSYFKMGLYRDEFDYPQTIYFSHFRRGPNKESCLS